VKRILLWLLLANAIVFAVGYYMNTSAKDSPEAARLKPLNPDAVKILSPQQISTLGPAKMAQLTLACAEWGPFSETERQRAMKLMESLNLGRTVSARRVDFTAEHWVYIPPKQNRAAADKAMAELKKLNVEDAALILERGEWNWAISLGVFRSRIAADAYRETLRTKGVKTAAYRNREQTIQLTSLVLREPSQATIAALETARQQISDSTFTTGACPENR
jgi:hypothetical protein